MTVVILTYERPRALVALLESLLRQELGDLDLELILCNNSATPIAAGEGEIQRLLTEFPEYKLFDSNYNWRCSVRYAAAALAKHDTVLFLDDDVVLLESGFVRYMFDTLRSLRPVDIVSCWTMLWVSWDDDELRETGLIFRRPEVTELTQSDVAGPGICIFRKRLVLAEEIWQAIMSKDFPKADDMAFSIVAAMAWGSRSYYLPSSGMLRFHDEWEKDALFFRPGHNEQLYAQYKSLVSQGYKPVLSQITDRDSPEWRAARTLRSKSYRW